MLWCDVNLVCMYVCTGCFFTMQSKVMKYDVMLRNEMDVRE